MDRSRTLQPAAISSGNGARRGPLRRNTEFRQLELVREARKIVASDGMEGLTIESLARSVGITGGAVFRHFADKEAILIGLIEDIDRSLATIRRRAAAGNPDPVDNLKALMREHLSSAERRRGVSFVVIAEVMRSRNLKLRTRMHDVMNRHLAEVERLLADASRSRLIRRGNNARAQAIALFGLVQGAVTLWKIGSEGARPAALFESLWGQYLNGIRQSIR